MSAEAPPYTSETRLARSVLRAVAVIAAGVSIAWFAGVLDDSRWTRLATAALFLSLGVSSLLSPQRGPFPRWFAILLIAIMVTVLVVTLFQFFPE